MLAMAQQATASSDFLDLPRPRRCGVGRQDGSSKSRSQPVENERSVLSSNTW